MVTKKTLWLYRSMYVLAVTFFGYVAISVIASKITNPNETQMPKPNESDGKANTGNAERTPNESTKPNPPSQTGSIREDVPFISQAPFGNWDEIENQEGCEEASLLMAYAWAKNVNYTPEEANAEIKTLSRYEEGKL